MDTIDDELQIVKVAIFKIPQEPEEIVQLELSHQLSHALECYNMQVEDDDDDPQNIKIPKTKGSRKIQGPLTEDPNITAPLKMKQGNNGKMRSQST